jgi:hypothetical protein
LLRRFGDRIEGRPFAPTEEKIVSPFGQAGGIKGGLIEKEPRW